MSKNKTTSSKRSTVSTAKKKGLLSKLNLGSKRNQFIAVILIVAVMGGGWFTYRSFAANEEILYTWNSTNILCTNAPCGFPRVDDPAKSTIQVIRTGANAEFRTKDAYRFIAGVEYKVCVNTLKGQGSVIIGDSGDLFTGYLIGTNIPARPQVNIFDANRNNACARLNANRTATSIVNMKATSSFDIRNITVSRTFSSTGNDPVK